MSRSPITKVLELYRNLKPEEQALFLDLVEQPKPRTPPKPRVRKKATGLPAKANGGDADAVDTGN